MMTITLESLLHDIDNLPEPMNITVSGLSLDSRTVKKGEVFFACAKDAEIRAAHIKQALANGAEVIVQDSDTLQLHYEQNVWWLSLPDLAGRLGEMVARFYSHPSQHMPVIGVTGTNGKTSTTHYIAQYWHGLGKKAGVLGTVGNGVWGALHEGSLTTADPLTIQKNLRELIDQAVSLTAMEVSSHALAQGRVNGMQFAAAVFTNLTRDHLDYHGSMQAYASAKTRLFCEFALDHAIINLDDPFSDELLLKVKANKSIVGYTLSPLKAQSYNIPCVVVTNYVLNERGLSADIDSPWGQAHIQAQLLGAFNLSNCIAAIATLCALGVPLSELVALTPLLLPVTGRMQQLAHHHHSPNVVVDYAHTPDALDKALTALRAHMHGKGQLWCVFGCGGDRDHGKRPLMAKMAEILADRVVITSDNPRTESPEKIIEEITQGIKDRSTIHCEVDRAKAIQFAIAAAKPDDIVLLAGKGHETYQIIGHEYRSFSDVSHAQLALKKRGDK